MIAMTIAFAKTAGGPVLLRMVQEQASNSDAVNHYLPFPTDDNFCIETQLLHQQEKLA